MNQSSMSNAVAPLSIADSEIKAKPFVSANAHPFQSDDPRLVKIHQKVMRQERLTFEDGLALYGSPDILAVGWLANHVRERMNGNLCYFNVNRHINPTNVCVAAC